MTNAFSGAVRGVISRLSNVALVRVIVIGADFNETVCMDGTHAKPKISAIVSSNF
jgi:hypothetical protein